jgi:hypothetical protein
MPPSPPRSNHLMILRGTILAAAGLVLPQIGAFAQSGKMYRVGLISVGAPDNGILGPGMVRNFAKHGYAVDRNIVFERRAAGLVDQILKGASPADLPLELPTRFDLAVNLETAKTLGLPIPEAILVRADDVIE